MRKICIDCGALVEGYRRGDHCRSCEARRQQGIAINRKAVKLASAISSRFLRPRHKGKH